MWNWRCTLFAKKIRLFLLVSLPLAVSYAQQKPTLENLLCAIQERHMVVEQREAIEDIHTLQLQQQDYSPAVNFTNQVQVVPIDWGHSLPAMPPEGSLTGFSLQQRLELLSRASEQFDSLKGHYLNLNPDFFDSGALALEEKYLSSREGHFSEKDIPSVGRVTPVNAQSALIQLAQNVSRLRILQWPVMSYRIFPSTGSGSVEPVDPNNPDDMQAAVWDYHANAQNTIDYGMGGNAQELLSKPATVSYEDHRVMIQIAPGAASETALENLSVVSGYPSAWMTATPTVLHHHEYDDGLQQQYFQVSGTSVSQGFFYRFEDGGDLHPAAVCGDIYQFSKSTQYLTTPVQSINQSFPVHFQPQRQITEEGYWDYDQIVTQDVLQGDTLTLNPPVANMILHLGDLDSIVTWDHEASNSYVVTPRYSDPDLPAMSSQTLYTSGYSISGIIEPAFLKLTEPLSIRRLGPGTLGLDYPETGIHSPVPADGFGFQVKQDAYSIELGDGRISRGNQAKLTIRYWKITEGFYEELFHVAFVGDANEYEITHPSASVTRYRGDLVQTDVVWQSETQLEITQTLAQTLPDGMGTAGEQLKKFTFQIDVTPNDSHTTSSCLYGQGAASVTRKYVLTPDDVYFGATRETALKRIHVPESGDSLFVDLYSDGQLVRKLHVIDSCPARYWGACPEEFLTFTSLSLDGDWEKDRFRDVGFHPNGMPDQIFTNGPGAATYTYDANGTLVAGTQGPSSLQSQYTSGNVFTTTESHDGNIIRQSQLQWNTPGSYILSDTTPANGTDTNVSLWDPEDPEFPVGQIPWAVRQIEYTDGTVLTSTDILTTTNRVTTVFQGVLDGSGDPDEGIRTVTVYNRLGLVKSRNRTWIPDDLVLSDDHYVQSRYGPTQHTATDGFISTMEWNAVGELERVTGRVESLDVTERDAIGRVKKIKDLHTNVETILTPTGNSVSLSASSGGFTHTVTNTWNEFGDQTDSVFTGAQNQSGTTDWTAGVWSGTGDNAHTHAEISTIFDESTHSSVIRSKTGPGKETTVTYEPLGGIPCLRINAFVVQPGLTGGAEKPVSKIFVDGLGRTRRESVPDPSQAALVWQHTDHHYDSAGRLERIERPADPDLLFEYDDLSRIKYRALELNGVEGIQPGADAVFETTYAVQVGKWVEETGIWLTAGTKKILSREESDAVNRSFSQKIGNRSADTLVATTPAPGEQEVKLNNRVVFAGTPTSSTITDSSNDEADPLSRIETTLGALGVPEEIETRNGPLTRTLDFNNKAEPSALNDAGINSTIGHSYNPDASSTHDVDYGALDGPTTLLDPGASTTDVGGGGGMPHETGVDWSPTQGWKQTLSLAGGNQSEWHLNPAGMLSKKVHANGDEILFSHDSAGRVLSETTPAGTQSWTHDAFGGVESWTVGGIEQFKVMEIDLLGRPLEIRDTFETATRKIQYDNDKWTLDTVEWTDGPLEGFKLDEDADTRGRLGTLTVSKDTDDLYSVTHAYRGDSDRIDTLTITATGAPTVTIDVNGPGGMADEFVYTVNGQNTHTYSRSRNANGRLNGISAPGFSQSWDLDAMGRVKDLTTNGKTTTHGYHPINGSLSSAVSADESRHYTFNNRGELEEEVIGTETLAMLADLNQSGALTERENPRKLTLYGTFHTNAVAEILVDTNVVHTTSVTPFSYTFDETTLPALTDTNAVVTLDWSVVGTRPEEPGGTPYEGGNAVAEIAGWHLFAPKTEPITYDIATRRASDAFLNYGWDAANQPLMLEERHGPHRTEHDYDGSQRRVEKRVYHNGNLRRTHRFVYAGWLPVVEEVTDQWGNLDYRNLYVWGPGPGGARQPEIGATGQLALIIHQPKLGPPQLSAPVYNHRLDVVGLVDVQTGNVVARYGYTPFGKTEYAYGSRADHCHFRFAGAYFDRETDTYYFGYRHYHPRTKQWISRDPIGEAGGLNLFSYASNDPLNKIDVLGLDWMPLTEAGVREMNQRVSLGPQTGIDVGRLSFTDVQKAFEIARSPSFKEPVSPPEIVHLQSNEYKYIGAAAKAYWEGVKLFGAMLNRGARTVEYNVSYAVNLPYQGLDWVSENTVGAPFDIVAIEWAQANNAVGGPYMMLDDTILGGAIALSRYNRAVLRGYNAVSDVRVPLRPQSRGVTFFGDDVVKFIDTPNATLGPVGGNTWFMPLDDAAMFSSHADIARGSGMAPSPANAWLDGRPIFGLSFPTEGLSIRAPLAADAAGFPHFFGNGNTAVRTAGENGGFLLNNISEWITPGGGVMPLGSVLFEVMPDGSWRNVRGF